MQKRQNKSENCHAFTISRKCLHKFNSGCTSYLLDNAIHCKNFVKHPCEEFCVKKRHQTPQYSEHQELSGQFYPEKSKYFSVPSR